MTSEGCESRTREGARLKQVRASWEQERIDKYLIEVGKNRAKQRNREKDTKKKKLGLLSFMKLIPNSVWSV